MPTAYQVPQELLLKRVGENLKRIPQVSPPPWSFLTKTGSHRDRPPQERDWWYARCASVLRKLYVKGPLGLSDLEREYGGRKSVGYAKAHHRNASQSPIRKPLQQLEAAGLVMKNASKGRVLTSKGISLLDKLSTEIFKEVAKENPSMARYA